MPKHDFLSPKAISNSLKSKGLQKLKFYCQACKKQCRDSNGFKCHINSPSHVNQMKIFSNDPNFFINKYSQIFESQFLNILKSRTLHSKKMVTANSIYTEYISTNKSDHIHMNATRWPTLTSFVLYLAKTNKAEIEEIETTNIYRKFNIKYIDNNGPIEHNKTINKDSINDLKVRHEKIIEEQLELSKKQNEEIKKEIIPFKKDSDSNNIIINIKTKKNFNVVHINNNIDNTTVNNSNKRKLSNMEKIMLENENKKKSKKHYFNNTETIFNNTDDNAINDDENEPIWIKPGLKVKILTSTLDGGKYYNRIGEIISFNDYIAEVKLVQDKETIIDTILKIDQAELELLE